MKKHSSFLLLLFCFGLLLPFAGNSQCWQQPFIVTDSIVLPCDQNGQINISVSGGTGPYTFAWRYNDPQTIIATTQNLTGAKGGNYTVEIHDNNNQCGTYWFWVQPPFQIQLNSTPDNCPAHDGTATVTPTGGALPYSYLWSNGGTSATITNLAGGVYDVTVTDGNGCKVIASDNDSLGGFLVESVNNINLTTSQTNANCTNDNGSATVVASNGNAPYTYAWSDSWQGPANPAWTTATINGLAAAVYTVSVTDADGCFKSSYVQLSFTTPITLSATTTNENCNQQNGTATVVANGTTGPYTYLWSTGGTTASVTGLQQGYYSATVHDGGGCEAMVDYVYVNRYSPIQVNLTKADESCGNGGGSASVNPTLGTSPYSYLWSTGAATQSISSLSAGSISVTVTDNAGCSAVIYGYINNISPIVPNATHNNQVCSGAMGSAALSPTGGTAPYTYLWSTGATTSSINNLAAAYYTFTITDALGCQYSNGVSIQLTSGFSAYASATAYETCQLQNGAASANASGGTPPYTYLWSTGSAAQAITNLSAGYYTVTITAGNGCSLVKYASVLRTSPMYASISVTPASCIFTNDGSASVTVSGGTAPYTYQWGNGSNTASATGLDASWGMGVYVTDANGCFANSYISSIGYSSINCAAVIQGRVVDDANANCIEDGGENGLQNTVVSCVPGQTRVTNANGDFQFVVPAANYALTQYAQFRNQACPVGSILINGATAGNTYAGNNFYDQPLNVEDLRVSFYSVTPPRPGFTHHIRLHYYNDGVYPVSGAIDFVYDATASYVSGGSSVNTSTNTVTINFSNLAPGGGHGTADLYFSTLSTTALGTMQNYSAHITPDGNDATPPNNTESVQFEVVGSFDPNEKMVFPAGQGLNGLITRQDSVLKYVVHFQNTGNFSASFVAIRDTLDTDLDITSFKPGAASHDYRTQIMGENVLVFLFDPIDLPDSSANFEASNGFVSFYIKQKKNLADGTVFNNRAAIYFDFNEPVITNTTVNTLDLNIGINEVPVSAMHLLPNPASDFTTLQLELVQPFNGELQILNLNGQIINSTKVDLAAGVHQLPLNITQLPQSIYTVRLVNPAGMQSLKLVKQ